jgi:hypothetical protein
MRCPLDQQVFPLNKPFHYCTLVFPSKYERYSFKSATVYCFKNVEFTCSCSSRALKIVLRLDNIVYILARKCLVSMPARDTFDSDHRISENNYLENMVSYIFKDITRNSLSI